MGNVFANGLEISGKDVNAKTIAVMPDVCFTPPETPATPPGVPIPYPSFGMSSDTESGTGTVFIGGKTVNIKNKSDLSKTTGTEAGCAAKKGIITSKNTGKSYFNSWSNDVKFDGEPVIRMSDLATHNHGSPSNTVTWPHTASISVGGVKCSKIFDDLGISVHPHSKSDCNTPFEESEHPFENQMMQKSRGGANYKGFGSYSVDDAPCICMQARNKKANGQVKQGSGSKMGTPHYNKTGDLREFLKKKKSPKLKDAVSATQKSVAKHHEKLKGKHKKTKDAATECLKLVFVDYMCSVAPKVKDKSSGKMRQPTRAEMLDTPIRT